MANTVRLKRSAVQGKAPVVGDLALGELAVNTYDGKLYTKKNDGSDSIVEIGGGGALSDVTLSGYKVENGKIGGATSLSGEFDFFLEDGHVQRFNAATSGDYWPDFKVSSTESLASVMSNQGDTITATLIVASSSHYLNNPSGLRFKIDNVETDIETVYVGGSAPSGPNGSGWDIYNFTIITLNPSTPSYAVIVNALGAA